MDHPVKHDAASRDMNEGLRGETPLSIKVGGMCEVAVGPEEQVSRAGVDDAVLVGPQYRKDCA